MNSFIEFAARSETGKVRDNNEDNLFCNGILRTSERLNEPFFLSGVTQAPCVFAVCDGMGGEACGEIASMTAIETLNEHFEAIKAAIPCENFAVNDYVSDAAKRLTDIMKAQSIKTGTTLALVAVSDSGFNAYNLGDSRIYRFSNKRLIRITDDHTVYEEKLRMGLKPRPYERNVLTQCLGIYDNAVNIKPDMHGPFDVSDNQGILLCSDGLTDMLTYREISDTINNSGSPAEIVNALVDAALNNGGRDNVTCIFVKLAIA
ncbi:MAG: serine/threonine-protein phosphatase [Synergistaceae bacterium]|nr:serine/threonine-protein phosphatase [Synergistaceae bacterium]